MSKLIAKEDAEILALRRIIGVLEPLSSKARARVLAWVGEKVSEMPEQQPGPAPAQLSLLPAVGLPGAGASVGIGNGLGAVREQANATLAQAAATLGGQQ